MTKTGQIKIYSPETGCGVIQAGRRLRRGTLLSPPLRCCTVLASSWRSGFFPATDGSISGQPEACQITPRIRAVA